MGGQLHVFKEASSVVGILQDEQQVDTTTGQLHPPLYRGVDPGGKTKSAHSLLDAIDPQSGHCSSCSEKERTNSGTASAPILREWDTNAAPSLDKRRKLLSGLEQVSGQSSSTNQSKATPFGGFFESSNKIETENDPSSNIGVRVIRKSSSSGTSDSSAFTSSIRVTTESTSSSSAFVRVNRANEWQSLRAGKSFCPMQFGVVPFLCTDTDN